MSEPITEDELFEAQFKLQNCIRITTYVEDFRTEVNTGQRYVPVADYVEALVLHVRKGGDI